MSWRTSKIGLLPDELREQLNEWLREGAIGKAAVDWGLRRRWAEQNLANAEAQPASATEAEPVKAEDATETRENQGESNPVKPDPT